MRNEQEIRNAISQTEEYPRGDNSEKAGAISALEWVLGETDIAPPWTEEAPPSPGTRQVHRWELYREPEHVLLHWQFALPDTAPYFADPGGFFVGRVQWYRDGEPVGQPYEA